MNARQILNIAAYKFIQIQPQRLPLLKREIGERCDQLGLKGTVHISPEGINLFLIGLQEHVESFWQTLIAYEEFSDMQYKSSYSAILPFKHLRVKVKEALIPMSVDGVKVEQARGSHIAPCELKRWLDQGRPLTLLDTRNDYEVCLGSFEGAEHLQIDSFRELPEAVQELLARLNKQPLLLYCTSGIRCEKAVPLLKQRGFEEVYQLEGGILNYFDECGGAHFEGECFVFDERVALDSRLRETETVLCQRCQYPVSGEAQRLPSYRAGHFCPQCREKAE